MKRTRKIDTNQLLPFTYDDLLYIITADKKKASVVARTTTEARCNRRDNARSTLHRNSSDPADILKRGRSVDLRELKALEIAARSRIAFDGKHWLVPSQTSPSNKYRVTTGAQPSCACEDFQLRGTGKDNAFVCKHIIAARLVCARDYNGVTPAIVTDAVPKKPTYAQDWPKYDHAQRVEKNRFQALLFDLCRGSESPEQTGRGRRWKPMSDIVFACAFKVFCTLSSRRFQCDLDDALEKGYLTERMHAVRVCAYLDSEFLTPILHNLIVRSSLPLKAVETVFAPDSTGFSTSRFVRWYDEKYGCERSGKEWVKAHAICGVRTNIVTAVVIEDKNANDCPQFKPLVEKTAENFTVREVPADKAYLSHDNLAIVEQLGGTAFVPFKSNSKPGEVGSLWEKMYAYYTFRREEFLKHYHQRSNAESTFSMVKAKFRDHVRSKTDTAMKNEVLCKFLCHNIVVVHQSQVELGIDPVFWKEEPEQHSDVLPLVRPG
jgi:transposase